MTKMITGLTWQKRNKNRVNVELDGKYAFSLSSDLAVSLSIGRELNEQHIQSFIENDQYSIAYDHSLRLLSYRSRSEKEVRDRLSLKCFSSKVIDKTIDRLQKVGLISDARFAEEWIENRSTFRPRSHRFLVHELRNKGVATEIIQQALISAEDDETMALKAAKMYAKKLKQLDYDHFCSRLSGYLLRRGFNYGIVRNVVCLVWNENEYVEGTSK